MKAIGAAGRADLVWALSSDDPDLLAATAALLGYAPRARGAVVQASCGLPVAWEESVTTSPTPVPPAVQQAPMRPSAFWQVVGYRYLGDGRAPEQPVPRTDVKWAGRPTEPLKTYLLSRWRELQPRLRTRAALPAATRTPDVERAVGLISRGRQLTRVPYEQRLRWGPRLQIILDRSERLVPCWADQDVVGARLAALLPTHAVERAMVWDDLARPRILVRDGGTRAYRLPPPGSLVLVIGDLGCSGRGGRELRRRWERFGAALRDAGCRAAVLTPLPSQRWSKRMAGHWIWIPWERPRALSTIGSEPTVGDALKSSIAAFDAVDQAQAIADRSASSDAGGREAALPVAESPAQEVPENSNLERLLAMRAERLLVLVSPAVRIEPGFLRAVRLLLLASEADAGTEIDVWQHPAITSTSVAGASLDPGSAARLRTRFAREKPELQRQVLALLRAWRSHAPQELWFEEIQSLDPRSRSLLPNRSEVALAEQFFRQLSQQARGLITGGVTGAAIAWYLRCERRLPERVWTEGAAGAALQRLSWAVHKDEPDYRLVATFDPVNAPAGIRNRLRLSQVGGRLHLASPGWTEEEVTASSILGAIETGNGLIRIEVGAADRADGFWDTGRAPSWADSWGWDDSGAWVTFSLNGRDDEPVVQRMRWIEPGTFLMGSPADEPGRWEDEGPRHEVRIEAGFWLFDTPCTQALWEAVTGENPSEFKSPGRPVEQVSWEEVQEFLQRLNERIPGLGLALPSEAQWEYACRAGTDTALYSGPIEILGERNAPALDPIAWYGGNSGVGFELADGWDSSGWQEVQYPNPKSGTHPVKGKQPNPWGLYDMLGNVVEWVQDAWHESYDGAPVDGSVWESDDTGADRVIRGGSWGHDARGCRSAYRFGGGPDGRRSNLGFRCARVQGPESGKQGEAAERANPARPGPRSGEGRAAPDSARGVAVIGSGDRSEQGKLPMLLRLDAGTEATAPLPEAPAVLIRTDREQLTLRRITEPGWASAIGRDRYGLWTEISIEPSQGESVIQRLRWIPSGRFTMGSPPDEPGRRDAEGPQHQVVIGTGYWLFDTPCTQALWEAVLGDNLALFRTRDRPVEGVSWEDVQGRFLPALNERIPGFVLPSEAQWEYACRGGTETAVYTGPIEILSENNVPALDSIAWYGGNSNQGFELEEGANSSGWPERQYPGDKAGTHPVKGKQPNPWGLYDMLGNVWEWCEDTWHEGYDGAPADGSAWVSDAAGASRVIRGGSWGNEARYCRCASRDFRHPGYRYNLLGFRCARAQDREPGRQWGEAERASPQQPGPRSGSGRAEAGSSRGAPVRKGPLGKLRTLFRRFGRDDD